MYRFYKGHLEEDELDAEELAEVNAVRKVELPIHIVKAIYTTVKNPPRAVIDFREEIINRLKDAVYFGNKLYLALLRLTDKDVINFVVPFLRQYPHINKLNVSDNEIGDEGAKALAAVSTLRELKISYNNVSDEGAQALAKTKLKKLNVSLNNVRDVGIAALARNNSIEELDIIDDGVIISKDTLSLFIYNSTLVKLYANEDITQEILVYRKQACYNQKIAFLMGTHPRLGEKSLLFTAFAGNKPLVKELLGYVKTTPIDSIKQYNLLKNRL